MKKEKKFSKCSKAKNGYNKGKKDIYAKNVEGIIQVQKMDTQKVQKREALKYYTEGLGFRQTERLMHVSHVTVIN